MERKEYIENKNIKNFINFFGILAIIVCMFLVSSVGVSAKTKKETSSITTKSEITSLDSYTLTLEERGGSKEIIKGTDIQLKADSNNNDAVSFDDKLLQEIINKLVCLDPNRTIQPRNAYIVYQNNSYAIIKEMEGNKVNRDTLYQNIVKAIKHSDAVINLESANCYENPKITETTPQIVNAKNAANRYISSKITYDIGGMTQVLDGSTIKDWISFDANLQIVLYESMVRSYVDNLAYLYTSSLGSGIKVSGGYYGNNHSWMIDSSQETQALITNIRNGQTISKSPIYTQTAAAGYFSNVGDTFVEVDLSKQHVWFYKNGNLVTEGDTVTGNESNGNSTPDGVYRLYAKQRDTELVGEDYRSPVSFWMPFNKNIGLHDASWRSVFGGQIYKTDGSHGCVNLPYYLAQSIYSYINVGDTVICHY